MAGGIIQAIGALVGVILAGVIGVITYSWQENTKTKTAIEERRKDLYQALIRKLVELLAAKTGSARSEILSEIEKSWLFASDEVLKAIYDYMKMYDTYFAKSQGDILTEIRQNAASRDEIATSISRIFLAMRRDIKRIRPTLIDEDWIKNYVRVYEWGIIAADQDGDQSDSKGTLKGVENAD
jgi:hypothetical protein